MYLFVGARYPWLLLGKLILTNTNCAPDLFKSDIAAFFSLSQLPLYWKQASLFIFLSSLDQAFLKWFMSFADHFLQTGLLSCHAFMQVPHTSCVSVRAWPKELLLLLLLFKSVSDSCGMLLTWILTAPLVPAELLAVWALNCLKVTFILLFLFCWRLAHLPHWVPKGSCHRLSTGRRFFRLPSLIPHRKAAEQIVLLSCAKVYRIRVLHL